MKEIGILGFDAERTYDTGTISLVALAAGVFAAPTANSHPPHLTRSVLKSYHPAPQNFVKRGAAPRSVDITLKVGVKQSNQDVLDKRVLAMATPGHVDYGKHLSKDELTKLTAPSQDTMNAISGWLSSHGVTPGKWSKLPGDWISFVVPVDVAEKMLGTKYYIYEDIETGHSLLRTESYELPEALHSHIDTIQPTNYFGNLHKHRSTIHAMKPITGTQGQTNQSASQNAPSGCDTQTISPNCLRNLYSSINYTAQSTSNKIGIAGYLNEFASEADLHTYLKKYRTDIPDTTNFTIVTTNNGDYDEDAPGGEANLDAQTVVGVAYPTPVIYYSTSGSPPFIPSASTDSNTNEPYLNFTSYQLDLEDSEIPYVISTSYGDDEQTVPLDYAVRVCDAFKQMSARGQTLLFSSGDSGVGESNNCISNKDNTTEMFTPAFPASCPYGTAVGATHQFDPEVVIDFSGAGFSNYFARPSFQDSVVKSYIDKTIKDQYKDLYNASGRAYPDLSAQGSNFGIYVSGRLQQVSGTSASAPAVAAIISQLNDVQITNGKSPLGWLNPWLYEKGSSGFTDITSGSSPGCDTDGFAAAEGWDASAGWGTPNFVKLQTLLP